MEVAICLVTLQASTEECIRVMKEAEDSMDQLWLAILDSLPWWEKLMLYIEHPSWFMKARELRRRLK